MSNANNHYRSVSAARPALRALRATSPGIGSLHTLGALHAGHGSVIEQAASENEHVVVTVYPNKAQLSPGTRYAYDLERDVEFCFAHGATHVVSSHDDEMYPPEYRTFLEQGCYDRLDGTVVPFMFRGMITQCIRWISFVRPHRTYWGLKDIAQALLVQRAVTDLMIDTLVREVPCVRFRSGIPISSRLLALDAAALREVAHVYRTIDLGRRAIASGERSAAAVVRLVRTELEQFPMCAFRLCYVKLVEPLDLRELDEISLPFVLHVAVTNGRINHFDGALIRTEEELHAGSKVLWLDAEWPSAP